MKKGFSRLLDQVAFRAPVATLLVFLAYYVCLPPINAASYEFWAFHFFVLVAVVWAARRYDIRALLVLQQTGRGAEIKFGNKERFFRHGRVSRIFLAVLALPISDIPIGERSYYEKSNTFVGAFAAGM